MDGRILHQLARRIARRCRWIIQTCLREEEWSDADQEFYRVIFEELVRTKEYRDGE